MKKAVLVIMALMASVCVSVECVAKTRTKVRVCTFNIRLKNTGDDQKGYGWDVRRDRVAHFVRDNHVDICGMQEVLHPQLEDLLRLLPEYDYVGVGRTDGMTKGEYSPVFYLKEKYEVLDKGNFWLSETPDVAGSRGWDAALERIASYVKLRDRKTGKVFMHVNTHFDHIGVTARRESARLIMSKIQEIVGKRPAMVTGDFNVTEDDEAYVTMTTSDFKMRDAYHLTTNVSGPSYTWHDFCRQKPEEAEKIDFIFVTPKVKVRSAHIESPRPDAMLSDHNPHFADIEF